MTQPPAAPPEGQTGAPTVPAGEREAFEALRELVAVKDLSVIINAGTDGDRNSERSQRWRAAHEDYHRRQPLAWAAARAVVAADTK